MDIVLLFIIVCTSAVVASSVNANDVDFAIDYLVRYGYVPDDSLRLTDNTTIDMDAYLRTFQVNYNLTVNGELNNETMNLMRARRCGNEDFVSYTLRTPWAKRRLSWRFFHGSASAIEASRQAFAVWQKHSNLEFEYRPNDINADMVIAMKYFKHRCLTSRCTICGYDLDGRGGILAHAYYPPDLPYNTTEIHMDYYESWNYTNATEIPDDQTSFLQVLTHEIGHALGLSHSLEKDSIMYPFYVPRSDGPFDLRDDDIKGIQRLYGKPPPPPPATTTTTTSTSTTTSTTTTTPTTNETVRTTTDLCRLKNVNQFLIINRHLYIVHDNFLWTLDIESKRTGESPLLLTDWLTFLPLTFTNVSAMYQRPRTEEVVLFIDNYVYMFDIHSLQPVNGYPRSITTLGVRTMTKINAAIHTYTGRTLLLYNDMYYGEIDECTFTIKKHGYVKDRFVGLPEAVDSAFRYIDGKIYFFKDARVYVYDEFLNTIVKGKHSDGLSVVGIKCIDSTIVSKLIDLLREYV